MTELPGDLRRLQRAVFNLLDLLPRFFQAPNPLVTSLGLSLTDQIALAAQELPTALATANDAYQSVQTELKQHGPIISVHAATGSACDVALNLGNYVALGVSEHGAENATALARWFGAINPITARIVAETKAAVEQQLFRAAGQRLALRPTNTQSGGETLRGIAQRVEGVIRRFGMATFRAPIMRWMEATRAARERQAEWEERQREYAISHPMTGRDDEGPPHEVGVNTPDGTFRFLKCRLPVELRSENLPALHPDPLPIPRDREPDIDEKFVALGAIYAELEGGEPIESFDPQSHAGYLSWLAFKYQREAVASLADEDVPKLRFWCDDVERELTPAGNTAGTRAESRGLQADQEPKQYLFGWPEILDALKRKNNNTNKSRIRYLNNSSLHPGPIIFPGQGGQPKVDKLKLFAWWNFLEDRFDDVVSRELDKQATVDGTYQHGRDAIVAPGVAGSEKKRRRKKS